MSAPRQQNPRSLPFAPILFGLALDRWGRRVLALDPVPRAAGAAGRAEALRYDAFEAGLARVAKHDVAITQRRQTTVYQLKPHFPPPLVPSWSS